MASSTSQAWRIHLNYQGAYTAAGIESNLFLEEIPKPVPEEGQILVRMQAAGLNFRDLLVATADPRYESPPAIDGLTPTCDGAGIVAEVRVKGSRWKVGDRVVIASNTTWKAGQGQETLDHGLGWGTEQTNGLLQQYRVFEEDALAPLPANLTFEEAACLPVPFATAWNALFGAPSVIKEGEVLVTQGTGGVSIAALQVSQLETPCWRYMPADV